MIFSHNCSYMQLLCVEHKYSHSMGYALSAGYSPDMINLHEILPAMQLLIICNNAITVNKKLYIANNAIKIH